MPFRFPRLWIRLGCMLALAVVLAGAPAPAAACSYRLPPWYSVTASLSIPRLPDGVEIEELFGAPPRRFRIINTSSTPLYLISEFATGEGNLVSEHPFPAGYGPLAKAADGRAWNWHTQTYAGGVKGTWNPAGSAITLIIDNNSIFTIASHVAYFDNTIGDYRPSPLPLPAPAQREIRFAYGSDVITIPVEISYDLNHDYEPDAGDRAIAACERGVSPTPARPAPDLSAWNIGVFGGSLALILGAAVLWRRIPDQE